MSFINSLFKALEGAADICESLDIIGVPASKNNVLKKMGGPNKKDGSHNHKFNTGGNRTPAQKAGDISRRK